KIRPGNLQPRADQSPATGKTANIRSPRHSFFRKEPEATEDRREKNIREPGETMKNRVSHPKSAKNAAFPAASRQRRPRHGNARRVTATPPASRQRPPRHGNARRVTATPAASRQPA